MSFSRRIIIYDTWITKDTIIEKPGEIIVRLFYAFYKL